MVQQKAAVGTHKEKERYFLVSSNVITLFTWCAIAFDSRPDLSY